MSSRVLKSASVVLPVLETFERDEVQAASDEAFERGRAAGRTEATADLEHHVSQLVVTLRETADVAATELRDGARLDAETITTLAIDLASWFVDAAILAQPASIIGTLHEAISTLVEENNLVLSLAPAVASVLENEASLDGVTIRPDAQLSPGDFRLLGSGAVIERSWGDTFVGLEPELASAIRVAADVS